MSTQIKYAYRRHNTWIYRRTYPVKLQQILGSSLKRSLHTADAKVAAKRVAELNTTFDAIVQDGPVAYLCRPKCSFKPLFFRRRPDFSSPMLSAVDVDCRSH